MPVLFDKTELAELHLHAVRATARTIWLVCEARSKDGVSGFGEATLNGSEIEVAQNFTAFAADIFGREAAGAANSKALTLARSAALSGIDQALTDLVARQGNLSLAEALGLSSTGTGVQLYANINRGLVDRGQEGFAASAGDAVRSGFQALKIAPFEAIPPQSVELRHHDLIGSGDQEAAARIRAVRAAIAPDIALYVDCHWLLDQQRAEDLLPLALEAGVSQIECPIPDGTETLDDQVALKNIYNAHGVKVAGGELVIDGAEVKALLAGGALDVIMPDVKYVPSLAQYIDIARMIHRHGTEVSPHNPSGPVAHAVSWQIANALTEIDWLEFQYAETPLFSHLVGRPDDVSERAWNADMPAGPGIGLIIDRDVLTRHSIGHLVVGADGIAATGDLAAARGSD